MKQKFFTLVLAVLFLMPCALREDIDYTLELWSENSRTVRTVNSTLTGEKDVVTMDVSNLPNGIYFLTMKVDNEILTTEKMIINH